jgi:hypothetical protein
MNKTLLFESWLWPFESFESLINANYVAIQAHRPHSLSINKFIEKPIRLDDSQTFQRTADEFPKHCKRKQSIQRLLL